MTQRRHPPPRPIPNPNPNPNPNQGGLAVELSIKYPTEMDLEIEHWADTGEPTAVELKQHLMVDKG